MALIPPNRDEILLFNESAHYVWRVLHILTEADVPRALMRRYHLSEAEAIADADAILTTWNELGLSTGQSPVAPTAIEPLYGPEAEQSLSTVWFQLDALVAKLTVSPGYAKLLEPLLESLRVSTTPVDAPEYTLLGVPDGRGSLLEQGRCLKTSMNSEELIGAFCGSLLEKLSPDAPLCAALHAGAVARDGMGIVLAGRSGSGKSTLTAFLAARGLQGLCDDLVGVRATDYALVRFPVAIKIRPGSLSALARFYPQLKPGGNGLQILPIHRSSGALMPIAVALVFPEYKQGAAVQFTPLSVEDALQRLLSDRVSLGSPIEPARLAKLLVWLGKIERRSVVYSDLADAESCIHSLFPR